MLPRLSGLDVCRMLRNESDVPIIMLTAREDEVDRVLGLELGADDYVTKPFSTAELAEPDPRDAATPASSTAPQGGAPARRPVIRVDLNEAPREGRRRATST